MIESTSAVLSGTTERPPNYESATRNLDIATLSMIVAHRELPPEWKNSPVVLVAHRLYWEERDNAKST